MTNERFAKEIANLYHSEGSDRAKEVYTFSDLSFFEYNNENNEFINLLVKHKVPLLQAFKICDISDRRLYTHKVKAKKLKTKDINASDSIVTETLKEYIKTTDTNSSSLLNLPINTTIKHVRGNIFSVTNGIYLGEKFVLKDLSAWMEKK